MNPYQVLNVSRHATIQQITKARNQLIKKYHPDKHPHAQQATRAHHTQKTTAINIAYEALKDDIKRKNDSNDSNESEDTDDFLDFDHESDFDDSDHRRFDQMKKKELPQYRPTKTRRKRRPSNKFVVSQAEEESDTEASHTEDKAPSTSVDRTCWKIRQRLLPWNMTDIQQAVENTWKELNKYKEQRANAWHKQKNLIKVKELDNTISDFEKDSEFQHMVLKDRLLRLMNAREEATAYLNHCESHYRKYLEKIKEWANALSQNHTLKGERSYNKAHNMFNMWEKMYDHAYELLEFINQQRKLAEKLKTKTEQTSRRLPKTLPQIARFMVQRGKENIQTNITRALDARAPLRALDAQAPLRLTKRT